MQHFSTGHKDLILAIDYNLYGNRMVTAGADHLLKVWHHNEHTGEWSITDTWLAHDAEVTDVKWTYPFIGEHIGSVGEDGLLKIWQEDVNHAINSGRRFVRIFQMTTTTGVPFMSLDFKSIGSETYLAAITRDGHITICEPQEHASLSEWKPMWSDRICTAPSRMDETSFRVSWHKEKLPAWPAVFADLDRKSIGLAVSVGDTVRVFRTDKDRRFYSAASLEGAKALIRDVSWANGSMRGFDTIATASKDGLVRIYELHSPGTAVAQPNSTTGTQTVTMRPARSGIGAGLAGSARGKRGDDDDTNAPGVVRQEAKMVAELDAHATPWRVAWSFAGDVLISTGDDAIVRMWKKSIDGKWLEAIEIDAGKA
ncbi:hypothetical protein AMS68_006230 [Peltaster fructicola]|uniref:Uncharacterized protein n=1 Tax=Peltaster fructicola TaxID=286661 RepID=A0A6H0Y124_9PEZI|nr:hypothetical protein AMS68_006230 [Peltaster fructicola]